MIRVIMFVTTMFLLATAAKSFAFDTAARSAFVVDQTTGTVLMSKDADRPLPPASMSKLMTLNMLFEAIEQGRVSMDSKFLVSQKAHEMGGSTMFLRTGERVSVDNLIRGIIVQSGNDACVAVAEGLSGSEAEFARLMTNRAKELGMNNSTFANSSGWPHPGQRMSARDLVFLANRLITKFPQYYPYFSEKKFTWDNITQDNRNPLLSLGIGADGLKTGHTEEAGYGLVGSATQGDRRIIFMITGLTSQAERAQEAERITNWAFRQFVRRELFPKDHRIASAKVWIGKQPVVDMQSDREIAALVPFSSTGEIEMEVSYEGPIEAPIVKGDQLAVLKVTPPDMEASEFPLFASQDIAKGGILSRMRASAEVLGAELLGSQLFARD